MKELEQDVNQKPLTWKQYLVVASLLFGLFFGAGNLIFPIHLGQMAGANWGQATLGFLVTAVLLPLLSVLAISVTHAKGVYDIGLPLGSAFALIFMVLIHLTIGPLFGTPRTASISFTVGVLPILPKSWAQPGLFVFSALFFICAFLVAYKESNILTSIGKILNPLFLLLLFVIFLLGFFSPMGRANAQKVTVAYQQAPFFNGFLQGYNTMDALAGLAFGVTVVTAVRQMGKTTAKSNAKVTAKAGVLATSAIGLIYVALIWLGATTLNHFKLSPDGGVAFNQIVTYYLGGFGHALLATLITVTCLTTAVGLIAAFAQDFHRSFSKVSYHAWLFLMTLASFLTANFGLDTIISWSTPMLMFLYPFAMVLILLSISSSLFHHDPVVYFWVVLFTLIPAFLDMVAAFPPVVSQSPLALALHAMQLKYLPFAAIGMDWLIPALVGLVIGLACSFVKVKVAQTES
ncbi:branched-chain amino acid transport system II carrier protein [Lactobacillus sp. ESL0731]|uniref:branched-chain amino acid transport system II carrier protein n=1 Tax=unclassified Lactobacillus TaxID=2620435 RepID=UPI0023F92EDD|nr:MULTISPECIES: branched-chain amino acid transport system II carrier protein [unclassified Lactobacillus]WEV50363.1 branched-chain amino acid transport system II carrier protein [Lactobacillus sp. ESL0700]WEV61492.1 branched-chain amino acid transport system II carrier protein [Lactobacillus sp. ESL0731]